MTDQEAQLLADMKSLATRLIYTVRSGILNASNVEALTAEAKRLGLLS